MYSRAHVFILIYLRSIVEQLLYLQLILITLDTSFYVESIVMVWERRISLLLPGARLESLLVHVSVDMSGVTQWVSNPWPSVSEVNALPLSYLDFINLCRSLLQTFSFKELLMTCFVDICSLAYDRTCAKHRSAASLYWDTKSAWQAWGLSAVSRWQESA